MRLHLKRDDLLHPDFSGNKARKFHYWLVREFPGVRRILSYGSPQSNAMYSLSVLARMRGWAFEYHVDHIPAWLRENPVGNYRRALENGTHFIVGQKPKRSDDGETLWIEEGGRQPEAEEGVARLAQEIEAWRQAEGIERLTLYLPSGTGTTALYLQKWFRLHAPGIGVLTTPCVGGAEYLEEQFGMLEGESYGRCQPIANQVPFESAVSISARTPILSPPL
jgi:1-aminocyclopropane-1-carboxylate deaminase/D-cysteine desulfhydrase-like pyridoxal-dependent ACC family enzyme